MCLGIIMETTKFSPKILHVVYFNQLRHACTCVCMVENDQNHSKMSKKVPFSSCAWEAHVRLTKKEKFVGQQLGVLCIPKWIVTLFVILQWIQSDLS